MARRRVGLLVAALLAGAYPAPMQAADCRGRLQAVPGPDLGVYDALAAGDLVLERSVTIAGTDDRPCRFKIAVEETTAGDSQAFAFDSGADTLKAYLEDLAGNRIDNSFSGRGLTGETAGADTPLVIPFRLRIPAGQFVHHGRYRADLNLRLIDVAGAIGPVDEKSLPLALEIHPKASVNLAGTRGLGFHQGVTSYTVDFGELIAGAHRRVFVQVRANGAYRLDVSSENRGFLALASGSTATGSSVHTRIPYAADLQGRRLALEAPVDLLFPGPTSLRGESLALTITIGRVDQAWAGLYRDVITIDVTAP